MATSRRCRVNIGAPCGWPPQLVPAPLLLPRAVAVPYEAGRGIAKQWSPGIVSGRTRSSMKSFLHGRASIPVIVALLLRISSTVLAGVKGPALKLGVNNAIGLLTRLPGGEIRSRKRARRATRVFPARLRPLLVCSPVVFLTLALVAAMLQPARP